MQPEQSYLSYLPVAGLRPKSAREAAIAVEHFAGWRQSRAIDAPLLAEYRDHIARKKWAPSTRNVHMAMVKAMLHHHARNTGQPVDTSPLRNFKVDRDPPRVLTLQEIARLAAACDGKQTGRSVMVLLLTGMRHQEALGLRADDLDDLGVHIRAQRAKNRQGRVFPWHLMGSHRSLFDPMPLTWNRSEWDAIRKQAQLDMTVKDTRSTWVTYAMNRGQLTPKQICTLAGHTLEVSERNYFGGLIWGLKGDTVPEWMCLKTWRPPDADELARQRETAPPLHTANPPKQAPERPEKVVPRGPATPSTDMPGAASVPRPYSVPR